jgi:RNA polymerase sigma-70 factor (ECF subfamily)
LDPEFIYDDKSLLIQIRNGNIKAFESIFNKYSTRLYFFVLGYLKSHADTEEIIQNCFLSLWENKHGLDESCSLKNYMYTMAVNKVFNFLKHKAVHQNLMDYTFLHETENVYQTEKDILYNELKENVDYVMEKLPEQQKEIFRLSRFEGFTNKEIAGKLGLSVRTVENQIYRALLTIRMKLSNKYS